MISVRLVSMAMTGFYRTFVRPRTKRPLSFIKYDPVVVRRHVLFLEQKRGSGNR
ncbi:mitochondrial 54S ribosomal protein bL33m [Phyllosticta citriasiana]|uniref:mitochondrial 54S ribosomal protein bL33m n=1 Tax=Phyllosticta citriasiana TaxID=595635 RepID=UPI0030FDF299